MSAKTQRSATSNRNLLNSLSSLLSGRKTSRKLQSRSNFSSKRLHIEGLEKREMFSVSSVAFGGPNGDVLIVDSDNTATSVEVRQNGSNVQILETDTNRTWDFDANQVGMVEFHGGNGNDRFVNYIQSMPVLAHGGDGDDYLEGWDGNDELVGGRGNDTLVGYGGNDRLFGNGDSRPLDGRSDDNIFNGGAGDDTLVGGERNDTYRFEGAGLGHDDVWDQYGNNGFDFSGMSQGVKMDLAVTTKQRINGDLSLTIKSATAIADVIGSPYDDQIYGNSVNNAIHGGAGNDTISGRGGNDYLYGEAGNDTYRFAGSALGRDKIWDDQSGNNTFDFSKMGGGVKVDLAVTTKQRVNGDLSLTIKSATAIADVIGSRYADKIYGNSVNNGIHGGAGNDTIYGRGGNDYLYGDANNDQISGGVGKDYIRGGSGKDVLLDEIVIDKPWVEINQYPRRVQTHERLVHFSVPKGYRLTGYKLIATRSDGGSFLVTPARVVYDNVQKSSAIKFEVHVTTDDNRAHYHGFVRLTFSPAGDDAVA